MKAKSSSIWPVRHQFFLCHSASGAGNGDGLQAGDFGIAFEHLEAHAYFVDAVVEGFELGRLVDHVFRRRHLAAIVQPGGDVHRFPFLLAELEILVRSAAFGAGGACQHLGQFRHAGAVAAGVGALGVDGAGDQLMKASNSIFCALISSLFSSETAAEPESASIKLRRAASVSHGAAAAWRRPDSAGG
jgi:hypothetical protein